MFYTINGDLLPRNVGGVYVLKAILGTTGPFRVKVSKIHYLHHKRYILMVRQVKA